jgi:hypothetical protein
MPRSANLQMSLQSENRIASEHLSEAQLEGYASDTLDAVAGELAASHIELCFQCAARVKYLRGAAKKRYSVRFVQLPLKMVAVAASLLLAAIAILLIGPADKPKSAGGTALPPSDSPAPNTGNEAPAARLVALNDGGRQIILDAQGNLEGLDSLSAEDRARVRTALVTQKVALPKTLQELRGSSSALMGGKTRLNNTASAFSLLTPVGETVATDRPNFRWLSLKGAVGYQVTITDPAGDYREVATSPELRATRWSVDQPLQRGRVYAWQVTARTYSGGVKVPAPEAAEAKFKVLEQAKADEIIRAEKAYAGNHLALGVLYAEAGLLEKAEAEFQALLVANPGSSVAKNLLLGLLARSR